MYCDFYLIPYGTPARGLCCLLHLMAMSKDSNFMLASSFLFHGEN